MTSIMLVDSPPLDTEKLDLRWDPFLENKSVLSKQKVLWKPWEGYSRPERVYKKKSFGFGYQMEVEEEFMVEKGFWEKQHTPSVFTRSN